MTALARLLFPVPDVRRSPATLLAWWEARRPTYNLIVGATGIITLSVFEVLGRLPGHFNFDGPPLPLIIVYGICANVCYTFGFALEALLQRIWGDDVAPVGPTLWRHGLVFSVGLTMLPIGVAWIAYLVSATRWFLFGLR
jgi:hypothetical protein